MCGIAGIVLSSPAATVSRETLSALARGIAHRGPDGAGVLADGPVAIAHNRLAIIDLRTGDQPLHAGRASLVANGEIYNYRALRDTLPDTAFATGSDCEPPLHLWLRDGADFAAVLRGMYAIAVHDRGAAGITLARDPFGIKPLYTAPIAGGFAFASEPHALLDSGLVPRRLRAGKANELLQLQFTAGRATIFDGIDRVLPGETLICDGNGVRDRRRRDPWPDAPTETINEDAALARLDRALEDSVAHHQESDVPYGMFLSGGIDSAAVLAMMARLNASPVLAYTAGWDIAGAADERAAAAETARACGARHEAIAITEAMVWRHLPEIVACMDDPAADYAIIPTWFLARRARQDVKVVLSGEGGDEMLAGYGRYRRARRPRWLSGRAPRARGALDGLDLLREAGPRWREGLAAAEARAASRGLSAVAAAQAVDLAEWLPNDLLQKLDRCLMAHAVEGRTPFLDPAIAHACLRLPDGLKLRGGAGKYLLRKWLGAHCPAARPWARKQGFTVPVGHWIAGHGARLGPLVARQPGVAEIAHPDRVVALFRGLDDRGRTAQAAWALLFLALWHRRHALGLPCDGDVFAVLADTPA